MKQGERIMDFDFGGRPSRAVVRAAFPEIQELMPPGASGFLVVCDVNTRRYAEGIAEGAALVVLPPGEDYKGWASVELILKAAYEAKLGRDCVFIGIGGGVVTDMAAFAASVYMRGVALVLVSTTLLGMADAALGGKTGFDLFGIKNLVGTFRPADRVFMCTDALATLPDREFFSGLAEVIKTGVLGDASMLELLESIRPDRSSLDSGMLADLVARCVAVKGGIVEEDPTETGVRRALLNLGHTYGHALEAAAGLGRITHGEAVAWGMARACALGRILGVTSESRAERILSLLGSWGYPVQARHPVLSEIFGDSGTAASALRDAMARDKKKKAGALRFIVPNDECAEMLNCDAAALNETLEWKTR